MACTCHACMLLFSPRMFSFLARVTGPSSQHTINDRENPCTVGLSSSDSIHIRRRRGEGGALLAKVSSCLESWAGRTVICRHCCSEPPHAWLSRGACRPLWWATHRNCMHACAAHTYLTTAHHHAQVKRALSTWIVPSHHVRRIGQDNGGAKPACLRLFCDARRGGSGEGGKPPRQHVSRCVHAYFEGNPGCVVFDALYVCMHACMHTVMYVCMQVHVRMYILCTYSSSACEQCMGWDLDIVGMCSFL